ncbi:MAG: hypothetical protein R6U01_09590 [Halorubrum sp.]|uniref:hypothetical protein n=1 Tax=Halorubrum sp. TaxID=1879286 RepID=UPI003970BF4D
MPTIEITDDHRDRIEALREELTAAHAGPYASVDTGDALAYLLDLADAVEDPDRTADPAALVDDDHGERGPGAKDAAPDHAPAAGDRVGGQFDRDRARERLESRPRRHSDPDAAAEMDLYDIAAAFDVTGRSDMTKGETIDAILDAAESLATDPFSWVDVDLDDGDDRDEPDAAAGVDRDEPDDAAGGAEEEPAAEPEPQADDAGASQLDAMMSLLDTHDDKWREADGDARYEVDLPDGAVETARTKDDVRALLFKNY